MKRESGKIILIPNHSTISKGTLKAIYNQALVMIGENELHPFFFTE